MMPPIKKETLYSEDIFLRFCARDEFDGEKLGKNATMDLLKAAEKDELIAPLLVEKVKRKKDDGSEEEIDIRYYSPFQIFLVAALIHNDIDEGELRSPDHKEWYKERGTRYITWGNGSSSWVEHYKAKRGEDPETMEHNIFSVADDFHKVVKLIHGLSPEDRYEYMHDNRRLFTRAPILTYNLDSVREDKAAYLEAYGINQSRLKRTIANVGSIATRMDPLERWFPYIQKHSRVRKDKLKGLAAVAQDLYGFCDIGYNLMEIAYGEKLPPLLDFLHPDIRPYMMEKAEYAGGEDIQAIKTAFQKLVEWAQKNKDLIDELAPTIEYEKLDTTLTKVGDNIKDYQERYGDVRYVGSTRRIKPETKKLTDLDEQTKKWAESLTKQHIDIEEKERKLTGDDRDLILAREIAFAIERRLGDVGRAVSDIAYRLAEATWPLTHKTEREKEMAKMPALEEFNKSIDRTDAEYERKYHEFWRKGLKEYEKPYQEKIDYLDNTRNELHKIGGETRLVFCAACRKNPVQLHYAHLDQQVSNEAVCDGCIEIEKKKAISGTAEERKRMKYAEWFCDYCGKKVLLKFAIGNTISVTTLNQVPIQMSLRYGRMDLQAKCPECEETSERPIDWGWIS